MVRKNIPGNSQQQETKGYNLTTRETRIGIKIDLQRQ